MLLSSRLSLKNLLESALELDDDNDDDDDDGAP